MQVVDVTGVDSKINSILDITADRKNELISSYPQLADIDNPQWIAAINQAKNLTYKPKTILFRESTPCNNFVLILKGTVRVFQTANDGREMTLYRVEAGELCVLGLNSMLKGNAFNAIAETETEVSVLVLPADDFQIAMSYSETFRKYVVMTLADRLYQAMHLIQDITFNQLNTRLACMLESLFARNNGGILKITHQALAHELGTTREVISRILKVFEKQHCLKLSRGRIELSSVENLKQFSK